MKKNIYIKPEVEIVAALSETHLLNESKYGIFTPTGETEEGIEIIGGAWDGGVDPGSIGDVDSKGNNMWDGWED